MNNNKTKEVAKALEEAVEAEMNDSDSTYSPMKPGNLNASIEAIGTLSVIQLQINDPPSLEEVEVSFHRWTIVRYIDYRTHIYLNLRFCSSSSLASHSFIIILHRFSENYCNVHLNVSFMSRILIN